MGVIPGEVILGHDKVTRDLWEILCAKNIKVIHMMRDPRDQTVSRLFHIRSDPTHTWHHRFQDMSNDQAQMACIEGRTGGLPGTISMINLTKSWLQEGDKSLCVRYEYLKSNPEEELSRVLEYLGLWVSDALIRAIVERNNFKRLSVEKSSRRELESRVRKIPAPTLGRGSLEIGRIILRKAIFNATEN
jgi:hypothetical protein